ncbi:hypothetical protein V7150_05135 [Neobacillus drentensis]
MVKVIKPMTIIHILGIQMDVVVERTLEGVKKSEDEYINKTLELSNN